MAFVRRIDQWFGQVTGRPRGRRTMSSCCYSGRTAGDAHLLTAGLWRWYRPGARAPQPAIAPFDGQKAKEHQDAWAKYLGVPVETTNSIGMKLVLIPAGEFLMGSPRRKQDGKVTSRSIGCGSPSRFILGVTR